MKTRFIFLPVFFVFYCFNFLSQTKIFGTVTDESGLSVPGVKVSISGENYTAGEYFTLTNSNGEYDWTLREM